MPSPFPGMDPYAERADVWPELHNPLMTYLRDALQPVLPQNYVARLELRIYTEREPGEPVAPARVPDLELVRTGAGRRAASQREASPRGFWIDAVPVERREAWIAVRSHPTGELVTAVELLSPSNKRPGPGRDAYLKKQQELLDAPVSLIEIDLLRGGEHTLGVHLEGLAPLPRHDYRICTRRARAPWGFWVEPWTVRHELPPLQIPLGREDGEIELELQPLFARAYDNAAVRKLVDYNGDPEPPLREEDRPWAGELLRKAGLRGDAVA